MSSLEFFGDIGSLHGFGGLWMVGVGVDRVGQCSPRVPLLMKLGEAFVIRATITSSLPHLCHLPSTKSSAQLF